MSKRFILSPLFVLLFMLAGYEFYTSLKGRELLTAAHLVEGLAAATPVRMQVAEFYYMQGDFPISNAELGLPSPASFAGRSVKSIEVSLGGKITIAYNNALKKDSSIMLTPSVSEYRGGDLKWACATETIEQSYFDNISMSFPCYYVPPGTLSRLMDSIVTANEVEAHAAILAGANINGSLHGDTPLFSAIARDRYAIVQQLIEAGADVNLASLTHQKITPLIHAVSLGKERLSELLLDKGARIDAVDGAGKTALIHAAEKGRGKLVELLLSRGANPLMKDARGRDAGRYAKRHGRRKGKEIAEQIESAALAYTSINARHGQAKDTSPLMMAASKGDLSEVQRMIAEGEPLNATDSFSATALHYAFESKHPAIASTLIGAGITVNSVDRDGLTPLLLAIKNGDKKIVPALLMAGAKVNVVDRYQNTPFLMAVRYGYADTALQLLNAGASETMNKALYETFASSAPKKDLIEVQGVILSAGLELKRDEKDLESLLLKAVKEGRVPVARFLLKHNVDLKAYIDGLPLHVAIQNGADEMARLLVKYGADVNALTAEGQTALMFAVKAGNIRLVKYLLDSGAKVGVVDKNGLTALRMAKANFAEDIVSLLRQHQ